MNTVERWARRAFVAAGLVLMSATAAHAGEVVLAKFGNGEVISEAELSAYLAKRVDLRQAGRSSWGVHTVLREMALTRALALEGVEMGEPRRTEGPEIRFDDVYAHAIFKKLSASCAPPADDAAAHRFFDDTPQAFRVPPMARVTRVMLPVSSKLDGEEAMAWLMVQAQAVASGTKKLDDVVSRAADAHKLDVQGDLGWVTLTDDVTILRALADAKQGDLVGPVREGNFGYLFRIDSKREARQLTWAEVATSVPTRAVRYCAEQSNASLRDRLFKKYDVRLDEDAIRGLFNRLAAKG